MSNLQHKAVKTKKDSDLDEKDNVNRKDGSNAILGKLMRFVKRNNVRQFNALFEQVTSNSNDDGSNLKQLLDTAINEEYLIVEAAAYNHLSIVKQLVKHDVNVLATDKNNRSALLRSCFNNNIEMCEYLMLHGADPNIVDSKDNTTPLISAAIKGNLKIIEYLFNDEKMFKHSFDWVYSVYL